MKAADFIKHFVFFIIIIKIVYSITYFSHIVISNTSETLTNDYDDDIMYWKEITEFLFIICMSILLIYHFFPDHNFIHNYKPIVVDKETKVLFLLFGFILLFSAKWTILFDKDSVFVKMINKIK
jgi:hypothetical protein